MLLRLQRLSGADTAISHIADAATAAIVAKPLAASLASSHSYCSDRRSRGVAAAASRLLTTAVELSSATAELLLLR